MNNKSKKRFSILKKSISTDDSSPTFTKTNRRISFSGKKSIKEFTYDADRMTIWGNSYEESAEIAQSASHNTLAADSTISKEIESTTQSTKSKSVAVEKENDTINLRSRPVLKRKSNVLKAISVQRANNHNKNATPNTEAVEMDISINEDDNKSLKQISFDDPRSPKGDNKSQINYNVENETPVPPQKITKLNQRSEKLSSPRLAFGCRLSDELPSDSCMLGNIYEGSNCSIPSRILDRGDVNITFGYNLSEFELLQPKSLNIHRPSENTTSFATKIDRINFSDEEESSSNNNKSVILQIENPKIEQMKLTGSIVTATDQNLDISIEISDNSNVVNNLPKISATELTELDDGLKPKSPDTNPVLEMFKIRNQLKVQLAKQFEEKLEKECFVPFKPANFEVPLLNYLGSTNLDKTNPSQTHTASQYESTDQEKTTIEPNDLAAQELEMSINSSMDEFEEKIEKKSSNRCTIYFQNDGLDTSISHGIKEIENICRANTHFPNQSLEMSNDNENQNIIVQSIKQGTAHFPNKSQTNRGTIYCLDQSLETSLRNENDNQTKRGTIHFPNQQLDISTVEPCLNSQNPNLKESAKRGTIYYPNQDTELSRIEPVANVQIDQKGKTKRGTMHFPNQPLEISMVEAEAYVNVANTVEKHETSAKRKTIHFLNAELECSTVELSQDVNCANNMNLTKMAKDSEHVNQTKRETIHYPNDELEMPAVELSSNVQSERKLPSQKSQAKRETIYFQDKNLETSLVAKSDLANFTSNHLEISTVESNSNVKNENRNMNIIEWIKIGQTNKSTTKRGTIHFPNQDLELSIMKPAKLCDDHDNLVKRATINFPNDDLEMSVMESTHNVKENREEQEHQTKRNTIHFANKHLEISTVELDSIEMGENSNLNVDQSNGLTKPDTVNFPRDELEISTNVSSPNVQFDNKENHIAGINMVEEQKTRNNRRTIHYLNQGLDTSMDSTIPDEDETQIIHLGNIHFTNEHLDISASEVSCSNVNEAKLSLIEPGKLRHISEKSGKNSKEVNSKVDITKPITVSAGYESKLKRGTIHFSNRELDMSTMKSKSNAGQIASNSGVIKEQTNLETIYFPNQQMEISPVNLGLTVQKENSNLIDSDKIYETDKMPQKPGTIQFPNQELEISMNESKQHAGDLSIDYNNHEHELSIIELYKSVKDESQLDFDTNLNPTTVKDEIQDERQIKRETVYFPNEELEMSASESYPNGKSEYKNRNVAVEGKVSKIASGSTKRGTLYFPNEDFETSMVIGSVKSKSLSNRNSHTGLDLKRDTIYFHGNNHLDKSILDNNQIMNELNSEKMEKSIRVVNRGTTYFQNEEMDASVEEFIQIEPLKSNHQTVHYSDENDLNISIEELKIDSESIEVAKRPKTSPNIATNNLDISVNLGKPIDLSVDEVRQNDHIRPQPLVPGTIYYMDKTLDLTEFERTNENMGYQEDLDTSEIEPKILSVKQPTRSTIYYSNQSLDSSKTVDKNESLDTNMNQTKVKSQLSHRKQRGTIHYNCDDIEMFSMSENKPSRTGAIPKSIHCQSKIQNNINVMPENNRKTIHYKNQNIETTLPMENSDENCVMNLEVKAASFQMKSKLKNYSETIHFGGTDLNISEISDQHVSADSRSNIQCSKPISKRAQSRIAELEEKIWGTRKSVLANPSRCDATSANILHSINNSDCIDNTEANFEDLNMSNDFDENHIKQQSTMTNLLHMVRLLSENRKNDQHHKSSDSINMNNNEMMSDAQLAKDLSGLKLFGHDSTSFENNTQALCNLDPKRIFCVTKYDAMKAAENSKHESITLTPKRSLLHVPIRKSNNVISAQSNISTHKIEGENTLQDMVPRFINAAHNTQDSIDITGNLQQLNKTRQEICAEYINLTISNLGLKLDDSLADSYEKLQLSKQPSIEEADQEYQNEMDKVRFKLDKATHVPVPDLTKCYKSNQPSFSDIFKEYELRNLRNLKRVSEIQEPVAGPEKPSLRFLMNNYREQLTEKYSEMYRCEIGIIPFLPLTPSITTLLQNKLAEREKYWTCHDMYYNNGILEFTHYRVPCLKIKMLFDFFEETVFGELEFTKIIPMMSKTKIICSTFELIQHLEFFKKVPSDMKNMCRYSNEILNFLDHLDSKIIQKNYEDIAKLAQILANTNSTIWHDDKTGQCGISKTIIHKRNIYKISIKINDLQITDISDVSVKPHVMPTKKIIELSRGLDFLQEFLKEPRDYLNFYE